MNKNIIISILAILLVISVGSAIFFFINSQKPPVVKEVVREVIREVPKEAAKEEATGQALCDRIPLYTGSLGAGSEGIYPNLAQDVCRLAFAADKGDVKICKDLKGPAQIHGVCYALVATKTQDVSACEAAPFEARDQCYLNVAKQTGNVSSCEKIRSINEKENCIRDYVSKTGDIAGCKKITSSNGQDNCYMNQAYRDPSLCAQITSVTLMEECKKNYSH